MNSSRLAGKAIRRVVLFQFGILLALMPLRNRAQDPTSEPDATQPVAAAAAEPVTVDAIESDAAESYERGYQGPPGVSDADRVAYLTKTIEQDEKKVAELKARLDDPQGEYAKAEAEFRRLTAEFESLKKRHQELTEGNEGEAARALEAEIAAIEKTRGLAKERFELAIEERKTLQEGIATIEANLDEARKNLARLTNAPVDPGTGKETSPADVTTPRPEPDDPARKSDAGTSTTPGDSSATGKPAANPSIATALGLPSLPDTGSQATNDSGKPAATGNENSADSSKTKTESPELLKAREVAEKKAQAAREARDRVQRLDDWLAGLERRIAVEEKQLATCRKRADNANDTRAALEERFREKTVSGASQQELRALMEQIEEAEARFREARLASRGQADRLVELQNERSLVLSEQLQAKHAANLLQKEYEAAEGYLEQLRNPLNPKNVLQWILDRGPKILAIVLAMLFFRTLMRLSSRRVVPLIASRGARGSREEREDRARTLVGVFENFLSVVILIGGTLMLLETCGIPVVPLLGGAAVVGLAVAFGAQNLVRDYFYGFMILLENQYKINDVVRLGDVSGQVEQITLRMTVLRDIEGNVHFVPNGSINRVTNMTHGWSRALFDISVAYKEDADHVMSVIMQIGKELRNDPAFRLLILEDPTMLGVDALGDSGITIKFFIKTRTLKQWEVKREMLRRIKKRFDELDIEIPFPQRVVHHRSVESEENQLRAIVERPHLFSQKPGG